MYHTLALETWDTKIMKGLRSGQMSTCNLLLQTSQELLSCQGMEVFPKPVNHQRKSGWVVRQTAYWNPKSNPLAYCILGRVSGLHIRLSRSRKTNVLATIKIRLSHAMHRLHLDICTQVQFAKAVSVETACRSRTELYQGIKGEGTTVYRVLVMWF